MLLPSHWLPVKIHQQPCPFGMFWCPLIRIWETSPSYHPTHKIRWTNIANFGHSEKPQHLSGSVPVGHHTLPPVSSIGSISIGKISGFNPRARRFPPVEPLKNGVEDQHQSTHLKKCGETKTHKNVMEEKKNMSSNLTTEKCLTNIFGQAWFLSQLWHQKEGGIEFTSNLPNPGDWSGREIWKSQHQGN